MSTLNWVIENQPIESVILTQLSIKNNLLADEKGNRKGRDVVICIYIYNIDLLQALQRSLFSELILMILMTMTMMTMMMTGQTWMMEMIR